VPFARVACLPDNMMALPLTQLTWQTASCFPAKDGS
jgi:hypothetical protein